MIITEKEFLKKIDLHKGIIFKISKMYRDNREDQEDLFQEIVYQAWKSYPKFKELSTFSTWLYRIALNTAIVFLKSDNKNKTMTENYQHEIVHEEYSTEKEEQTTQLYKAIYQLNAIDKALIFYLLENYSGKEIAEEMGISEVNARVKLNRAKQKLKEILQNDELGTNKK